MPYACVFGNHDDECSQDKSTLLRTQQESEYGLTELSDRLLSGLGNDTVDVYKRDGLRSEGVLFFVVSGEW